MKPTILIALLALTLPPISAVEDAPEEWTSQKALEEIHALIHWNAGRVELNQRREAIAAWLERLEEREMKLGEMEFVVAIARYLANYSKEANEIVVEYLKRHGSFPSTDYDQHLGRVLLVTAGSAANSRDFATVELTLPAALHLTTNKKLVYHRIGNTLRRAPQAESHRILNWMVRHVLDQPDLSDTEKQQVLEGLYGRGSTRTSSTPTPRATATTSQALGPRPLRPFTAMDIDGRQLALSDYRGKVVLVDFWATWCGPCLLEMPNVVRAYNTHHDKGFEIIGISLDHAGTESRVRGTMKRMGMDWRQIYEGKGWNASIALENGVRRIPTTFLLDRTGKVRYTSLRGRALDAKVAELLAEAEPAAATADG